MSWLSDVGWALVDVGLYLLGCIAVFTVVGLGMLAWEGIKRLIWPPPPRRVFDEARVKAVRKEIRQRQTYCWYLEKAPGRRRSHLGGVPYLRSGTAWPRSVERSMSFVAQINLADVRRKDGPDWLPEAGLLLFFADGEADACAVIHEPDASAVRAASEPSDLPTKEKKVLRYSEKPVFFRRARSWPRFERLNSDPTWEEEEAAREPLRIAEPPSPAHQIGGFPETVQWSYMEWECELSALGRPLPQGFGDWLKSPEATAMAADVNQWKLLLQVESDDDVGFDWIAGGTIYYWIKEQDARAGDFSKVQMIAQFT